MKSEIHCVSIQNESSQGRQGNRDMIVFLRRLIEIQNALNFNFYFVGGCIRDAFLGIQSMDIDIATDGELDSLGQILSSNYDFNFSKLGTAKIKMGAYHVDLASFREEIYSKNNGLPEVVAGDLSSDIMRRDFTINTGYILLSEESIFWILNPECKASMKVSFAHPLFETDIETRTLRILHELSFEEDASRVLRAIKYMTIYHLELEPTTLRAFKKAIDNGRLELYSRNRYRQILLTYIEHPMWVALFTELYSHGAIIDAGKEAPQQLIKILRTLNAVPLQLDEWTEKVTFLLLLYENNLSFWFDTDKKISNIAKTIDTLIKELQHKMDVEALTKYNVYKLLKGKEECCIAFLMATSLLDPIIKVTIEEYVIHGKYHHLTINGNVLKSLGFQMGKEIGTALNLLLEHEVNFNKNLSREEEIEWIESYIYEHRDKT